MDEQDNHNNLEGPIIRYEDGKKKTSSTRIPSQKDLEKEIGEYLSNKYGGKVKVISHMLLPEDLEDDQSGAKPGDDRRGGRKVCFNLKPEELEAYLNRFVIGQEEAKSILATKVCTHFNRIEYMKKRGEDTRALGNIKNNIILIGPTGVGKTFLVRLIADRIGVPFVKGDATKFSETGYVGGDVEDLIRDLVNKADGDIEEAQYGIVYIDEIDKIASSRYTQGPDISRTGVQRALLKLLEETEVDLQVQHDPLSQLETIERYRRTGERKKKTINTRNILFIVSGAFFGLSEVIRKRLSRQGMGFGAEIETRDETDWIRRTAPHDLIEYGFESEFVGRFPVIAPLHGLSEDDLYNILKNPNSSVITRKKQDFRAYGIDLRFDDGAIRLLASQASLEQTGARALVSVVEKTLMPFEKKLPSTSISRMLVTKSVVEQPSIELERLLANPDEPYLAEKYENALRSERHVLLAQLSREDFNDWHKAGIQVSKKRMDIIAGLAAEEDMPLDKALKRVLSWIVQIKRHEDAFLKRCGIKIMFEDNAIDILLEGCIKDSWDLHVRCETICKTLEYGLTLIMEKTGQSTFSVPDEAVAETEPYINRLIRASYRPPMGSEAV